MIRYAATVAVLTLVYALALASFHPWDLILGAILSSVFLSIFKWFETWDADNSAAQQRPGGSPLERFGAFFLFVAVVSWEILSGGWRVFLVTVGLKRPQSPGIVVIPLGERSRRGASVSAFLAAFTPGTLLVEVDEQNWRMLIHAVDAADPEAVRESQEKLYQRYQKKVFP